MSAAIEARQLKAADLAAYRALQRFALTEAPDAFAQTVEQDASTSDEDVAAWLDRGEAWGVFKSGALVGKLVMDALPYAAFAHTRWLHAVYIHPDARSSGAGEALMAAAAAHAREQGVTRLLLWVHSENGRARAFYEKIGFRETGMIPGGIRVGDHFVDDILMWMPLR
jgi:ribosomal protein S18 acetylase RimI-like enzyme